MSVKVKNFFKKLSIIFTWRFSPIRIIFYGIFYKIFLKGILLNLWFEGARGIHVATNRETFKQVRDNTIRAIIYSVLITFILVSILEYNFNFINNFIDTITSFFTSIEQLF